MLRNFFSATLVIVTLFSAGAANAQSAPKPYQFTPTGAMQSQLSVTTGSVVTLTIPAGSAVGIVCIRSGGNAINYSYDGSTTPTTSSAGNGFQLSPGQCVSIQGATLLANFKMIAESSTTGVDIGYTK